MNARRSSKEPKLAPGNPLAPVVEQLKTIVRGLAQTEHPLSDADTNAYIRGKIEGIESAITLLQRAGANGVVLPDGQHLVQVGRATATDPLEARVAALERQVARLSDAPSMTDVPRFPSRPAPEKNLPEILKAPRTKGDAKLGRCERALLVVLAQRKGERTTDVQLAVLSGYSRSSSSFANALGVLRSAGLARGSRGDLHVTDAGQKEAGEVPPMPQKRALMEAWCTKLGRAEAAMLRAICHAVGGLTKEQLAERTGYSLASSSFANAIGKLRGLDLVSKGWPVFPADVFF